MKRKHGLGLFGVVAVTIAVICIIVISPEETPENSRDNTKNQASKQAQDVILTEIPTQKKPIKTQFADANENNKSPDILDNVQDDDKEMVAQLEELTIYRSVFDEMSVPINNNLPDVSKFEEPFEDVVSLQPFLAQNISEITYDCEVTNLSRRVENNQILSYEDSSDDPIFMSSFGKTYRSVKNLFFEQNDEIKEIRFIESIEAKGINNSL